MHSSAGSVTLYIQQLKAGQQAALQKLWEGYFGRMVRLARKKLQGVPRQMADEDDAAQDAFASFYRGVERGRFPQLLDRHDLWQVLVLLTARKASNLARHARAPKRGGGRVQSAEALCTRPPPCFAARACRARLDALRTVSSTRTCHRSWRSSSRGKRPCSTPR